jgi:hypothetical protein
MGGGRTADAVHTDATQVQAWELFTFTCNAVDSGGGTDIAPLPGADPLPTIRCGLSTEEPSVRNLGGLPFVSSIGSTTCYFKGTTTPANVLSLGMWHDLRYSNLTFVPSMIVNIDYQSNSGRDNIATEPVSFCIAGRYSTYATVLLTLPPGYPPYGAIYTPDLQPTNISPDACSRLPSYSGMSQNDAVRAIEQLDLIVGSVTSQPSSAPVGSVISQSPPAGARTVRGVTVVNLVLSSGNATVPDVVGFPQSNAFSIIHSAGLVVGQVHNKDDCISPGDVETQNPPGGTRVISGEKVDLTVSTCDHGDPR